MVSKSRCGSWTGDVALAVALVAEGLAAPKPPGLPLWPMRLCTPQLPCHDQPLFCHRLTIQMCHKTCEVDTSDRGFSENMHSFLCFYKCMFYLRCVLYFICLYCFLLLVLLPLAILLLLLLLLPPCFFCVFFFSCCFFLSCCPLTLCCPAC